MRTIQEILKTCDRKRLLDTYDYTFPVKSSPMMSPEVMDMSIADLLERRHANLSRMIDRMISLEPELTEDGEFIMFAHKILDVGPNDLDDLDVTFVNARRSHLLKDPPPDFIVSNGYEFLEHKYLMSIKVAETYLTRYYLYDLLADFLHEASFFGCDQQYLEEEKKKLDDAIEDMEKHPESLKTLDEDFWRGMFEENGWEYEERDPAEKEAYNIAFRKVADASIEYNTLCNRLEAEKVRKLLRQEEASE